MTSKLTQVIDELVQEKTFSLAGVEAIKKLRDHAVTLESELTKAKEQGENQRRATELHVASVMEKTKKIDELLARETLLTARETKVSELEKRTAVAEAEANAWHGAFSTVFRNTVTRETWQRQMPTTYVSNPGGGYSSNNWEPKSESVQRETE